MSLVVVLIQKFVLGMSLLIIIGAIVALLGLVAVDTGNASTATFTPNVTVFVDIPKQGKVMGNYGLSMWSYQPYMQFLGIPYAESPTNHSRFKHPTPRLPWSTTHDGTKFGKRCPVITTVSELTPQELKEDLEDCLNLCVYTKDLKAKRPVMFYVYGGGFYNGSSSDHPPRHLMEKDIVVVVPQYRVGALGWAATFTQDMPGNAPLADILLALQWVQSNIRHFGGDPERVTIFGQSAGAYATSALLLSPKTPPNVFRHAIVQSGSIFSSLSSDVRGQSKNICRALNCTACVRDAEVYDCLREAPVLDLLKATEDESFSPVVGDLWGIMPLPPQQLIQNYNRSIPVMTGFTKHDGSFVLATYYDILKKEIGDLSNLTVRSFADGLMGIRNHQVGLTHQLFQRMLLSAELLNTTDHNRALSAYFDLSNVIFMKSPVLSLTEQLLARKSVGVYCYSFDYAGSNTRFGYEFGNDHYPFEGGVHHSNDNIYIWSTHKLNEKDTEMAKKMVDIWTSFAINGKPEAPNSPPIPAMRTPSGPYFHINTNITIDDDVLLSLTVTVDDPESKNLLRLDKTW